MLSDIVTQRVHFVTQRVHFVTQRVHFVTQRVHFVTQRVHLFQPLAPTHLSVCGAVCSQRNTPP